MTLTQCYKRFTHFKLSRTSIGLTSTNDENIDTVRSMIRENHRLTVREIAEEVRISTEACHEILIEKLGMHHVSAKLVPQLLISEQKENRMNISQELLHHANSDKNYMKTIIKDYETWVYGYDVEMKAQSSQWVNQHSPQPKKAQMNRSNMKSMLIVFFDCLGVFHQEFVPQCQTVNKEFFVEVLRCLQEDV